MTNLAVSPNLVTKFGGNFLLNSVDMRHDGDNLDYLTSPIYCIQSVNDFIINTL